MLFGQETQHVTGYWWADAALWTAIGGVIAVFGATVSRLLTSVIDARKKLVSDKIAEQKEIRAGQKEVRADAIDELNKIIQQKDADRQADHDRFERERREDAERSERELSFTRQQIASLQDQLNKANNDINTISEAGHRRASEFQKMLSGCQAEHMLAMKEIGDLKTENALLRTHVTSVALQTGVTIPEVSALGGVLTVGVDGIVREFSMALTPLLGWEPSDVIGKSVDMLVPERLRSQYRAMFEEAAKSNFVTMPVNKVVEAWALTRKEKSVQREVAVNVTLRAWSDGGFISGTIRPRLIGPPSMGAKIEAAHPDLGK